MKRPKWSAEHVGKTFLEHCLIAVEESSAHPIVVSGASPIEAECTVVHNPDWEDGMSSSIRIGVQRALDFGADQIVLLAVDQIFVSGDDVSKLLDHHADIAAASYDGVLGIPAKFKRAEAVRLLTLSGDRGAREILRTEPGVGAVSIPKAAQDIDSIEELETL